MMIIVLSTTFIHTLRIQMKQNIFILLKNVKYDLESLKEPKVSTKYSNNIKDVYSHIKDCSLNRKCNVSKAFDMIADVLSNKKLISIVIKLFSRRFAIVIDIFVYL